MSWWRWFQSASRGAHVLEPDVQSVINAWREVPEPDGEVAPSAQTWCVVDVETTGLDTRRDRLLAIGAVMVESGAINLDSGFEIILQQPETSTVENILVHRIGGDAQTCATPPASALVAYLHYAQRTPSVAFHAPFDAEILRRAFAKHLGLTYAPPFLDLADLAPALVKTSGRAPQHLDDWLSFFSIRIGERHRAIADAFGTAQLLQVLLHSAQEQGYTRVRELMKVAEDHAWLASRR